MRALLFAALTAIAVIGGAPAQAAAPCAPFTTFPLALNFGTGVNTGTGEDLNCVTKKIQAAVNALPALKGQAGGFASLDTLGFLPLGQLPTSISGLPALVAANTAGLGTLGTTVAGNTSAISTLNAKLGAANGIATLGSDGVLTAAQRPPNSGAQLPYVYAATAGNVVADGSTDQATNIQTAASTCPAKGCVLVLPCGDIAVSSVTVNTQNIVVQGGGQFCTLVTSLNLTGDVFKLGGNYSSIRDVGFKQKNAGVRTAGYTLRLSGAYQTVKGVHFENCYRCIFMGALAGWQRVEDVDMFPITPEATATGSGGIVVWNPTYGPNNRIDNVLIYGGQGNPAAAPTFGINIVNSGATVITNSDVLGFKQSLLVNPGEDTSGFTNNPNQPTVQTSQALRVSNTYFDSALGSANVAFRPSGQAFIFDSTFTGVWLTNTGSVTGNGLEVLTNASTRTDDLAFKGLTFDAGFIMSAGTGGNNGFLCTNGGGATAAPSDITISNTGFGGWGQAMNVGCNDGTLIGNRAGNYSPFGGGNGKSNTFGVYLNSGVDKWVISGNRLIGNASAGVSDNTTGANVRITDNLGYNGNQPATTVTAGASPYTYTNGHDPATLYVIGGTISSIVAPGGNKTLGGSTSGGVTTPIQLGPNESIVITYTSAPALTRMPH